MMRLLQDVKKLLSQRWLRKKPRVRRLIMKVEKVILLSHGAEVAVFRRLNKIRLNTKQRDNRGLKTKDHVRKKITHSLEAQIWLKLSNRKDLERFRGKMIIADSWVEIWWRKRSPQNLQHLKISLWHDRRQRQMRNLNRDPQDQFLHLLKRRNPPQTQGTKV